MHRVILAAILAPILVTIVALALGVDGDVASIVLLVAYVGTLAVGIPVFLLFRWLRWLSFWQAPLGGLLAGAMASIFYALGLDDQSLLQSLQSASSIIAWSVVAAMLFWLLAVPGNYALTRRSSGPAEKLSAQAHPHRPPAA